MKKLEDGITLLALVVTIIILLILAGLSISILTGSGLFEKAKEAKEKSKNAQELETSTLLEYEKQINELGQNSSGDETDNKLAEEIKKIINVDTEITDPIKALPKETKKVLEGDANKGIVIQDNENNEWTWVEVPKTIFIKANHSNEYDSIEKDLENYLMDSTFYRTGYKDEWYASDGSTFVSERTQNLTEIQKELKNGCGLTYNEYKEMYNKMLSSLYTNGGFWISRYEAGIQGSNIDDTKSRYTHTDITEESLKAISQRDMIPYNYIYCREAQLLANKMYTGSDKIVSLLFGIQWDLVCIHIDTKVGNIITKSDCSSWGNYKDSSLILNSGKYNTTPYNSSSTWKSFSIDTINFVTSSQTSNNVSYSQLLTTGASNQTNKMNIYDFAGNESEWTLEQRIDLNNLPSVSRGGGFDMSSSGNSASSHYDRIVSYSRENVGFRSTLY